MVTLKLLGGAVLLGSEGPVQGRIAQRRQIALLAFLSLQDRPATRDRLLALLWPEADAERARHSLSDALYVIRRAVGDAAVRTPGDAVALDPESVRCDVRDFHEAIARGDPAGALSLYDGPLLDGFHYPDSQPYEEWLADARAALARAAVAAAESLADACTSRGEGRAAADAWRRAAALDPHDTRIAIELARATAAAGDRAGAVRALRAHAARIEADYGVPAPPEVAAVEAGLVRRAGAAPAPAAHVAGATPLAPAPTFTPSAGRPAPRRAGWVAASVVALVAVMMLLPLRRSASRAGDPDPTLAVMLPLRVSGADARLGYLREGVIDLLAIRLGDEPGRLRLPPTADVLAAWRTAAGDRAELPVREASAIARRLGAGRLILGAVVGSADRFTLTVEVIDVATGRSLSQSSVAGAERSLFASEGNLIDALAAHLLGRAAGEPGDRLADLATRSPDALEAYIDARIAHRRGDYAAALGLYDRAMAHDSTFALAGLGALSAAGWVGGSAPVATRGRAVVAREFDRLSPRDRVGITGRLRLERDEPETARLWVRERSEALRVWPDHPTLHYLLGEAYFHHGPALDGDWEHEAIARFDRAIALDPAFAEPVHHLFSMLAGGADTARLLSLARRSLDRAPSGPIADYVRWRVSHAAPSTAMQPPALEAMDTDATLRWIGLEAQDYGFAFDDGHAAVRTRMGRPGTRAERLERHLGAFAWALNRGRPAEASAILTIIEEIQPAAHYGNRRRVLAALYADGDTAEAAAAARAIAAAPGTGPTGELNRCIAVLWALRDGPDAGVDIPDRLTDDQALAADRSYLAVQRRLCALVRDVRRGAGDGGDAWHDAVRRLDTLLDRVPIIGLVDDGMKEYAHLALARALERAGEPEAALHALDRRARYSGWQPYLAPMLETEARLARRVGDAPREVRALRHYLGFRVAAEPSLQPRTQAARVRLAELVERPER